MPESSGEIGRRVGRNTLYLLGGEAATKLLAAIYQILLARYLGAAVFGEFSFALALTAILGVVSDFGLSTLVTREVARRPEDARDVLSRALLGRTTLAVLLGALGVLLALGTARPRVIVELVAILAVSQLVQGWAEIAAAAHRGLERMLLPAATGVVCRAGLVASGGVAVLLAAPVQAFAILTALWTVPAAAILLRGLPARPRRAYAPTRRVLSTLGAALPIGLGMVLWSFYFRIDLLLLGWFRGDAEAGVFAAPYRLVESVLLLQVPVLAAVFPVLSRFPPTAPALRASLGSSVRVLLLAAGPIVAVFAVHAEPVLRTLFGPEYAGAGPVLVLLALAVPLSFVSGPFLRLLLSQDRETSYLLAMGAGAIVNPAVALPLIGPLGATGAAIATLATEAVVAAIAWRLGHGLTGGLGTLRTVLGSLAPGAETAAAFVVAEAAGVPLAVQLATGLLVVFPAVAFATRAIRGEDLVWLLRVLGRPAGPRGT